MENMIPLRPIHTIIAITITPHLQGSHSLHSHLQCPYLQRVAGIGPVSAHPVVDVEAIRVDQVGRGAGAPVGVVRLRRARGR